MEVYILGTGTSQGVPVIGCTCEVCLSRDPKDTRLRSSIVVQSEKTTLLVDVGPDFRAQMLQSKIPEIDGLLITHEHNDHVIGLDDLRPFVFAQAPVNIPIWSLSRVLVELKERFQYAFSESKYPGAPSFDTHVVQAGDQWIIGDIQVEAIAVQHGDLPILGYRFNDLVYLTDVKTLSEESIEQCKGAKILIINSLRDKEHWSHLNLDEAIELIEKIKPEKTYLTHMSHLMGRHSEIALKLPSNVYPAYDGLILRIN